MSPSLVRLYVDLRTVPNRARCDWQPPRTMPPEMVERYTQGGTIPVLDWYIHEGEPHPLRWTTRSVGWSPARAQRREKLYYGDTDLHLHAALDACPMDGAEVVVLGSQTPRYECLCVGRGARVTTIEHPDVHCQIPGLRVLKPAAAEGLGEPFDVALSISSVEHAGLGRYGDPLDPDGDLAAMRDLRKFVRPGRRLLLAVPVGADVVVWNAHRICGHLRLPRFLEGWRVIGSFGYDEAMMHAPVGRWDQPPGWLLTPDGA